LARLIVGFEKEGRSMKVVVAGERPFVEQIGQLCAQSGHDTVLYLVENFNSAVRSGWSMDGAAGADVAIELQNESAAAKEELLRALAGYLPPNALIMTSALATSATQAASWVPHPERVIGFGVLPPLRKGSPVEVARAMQTADETVKRVVDFIEGVGQTAVFVNDGPGLVRARTVCCIINEACSALMEDVATASDIDQAMQLGTNYPYGPLAWADYIGLDTVLGIITGLFQEWGEDRYRPSPLLRRMVQAGKLGRKSGSGFYNYQNNSELH